jgi:inner membrane protein involved in colicin E2 resistance
VQLQLPLAGAQTIFDGFQVEDDAGRAMPLTITSGAARWSARFAPGEQRSFTVRYRSRGTTRFGYQLADASGGQVKSFHLALDTNFAAVDFPPGSLSPSSHGRTPAGWHGDWRFATLVGANPIALALPQPLNPGPLAARITFFAPVGLLFFFFVVAVLASSRNLRIHPLNYFFFGCAFFAFHLLFGYLVDHLAIGPSFSISAAVSIALVTSYARLFVGERFAFVEMAIAQLLYLVLFSFTFFWTGFTGLAITVGAILTLFVMMQVTGRVRWSAAAKPPVAHS